jgi:hypothetical protein
MVGCSRRWGRKCTGGEKDALSSACRLSSKSRNQANSEQIIAFDDTSVAPRSETRDSQDAVPQVISSDGTDHVLSRMFSTYFRPIACFVMMH